MRSLEFKLLIFTAITLLFVINFNKMNIEIRIGEMKSFLQKSNRTDNNIDHVSLLMKYKIQKDLYEGKIDDRESSIIESRMISVITEAEDRGGKFTTKYPVLSIPVIAIINTVRYTLGIPPIDLDSRSSGTRNIELAYYYERNKNFKKAIELYSKTLKDETLDSKMRSSILLHQGFCFSILGNYREARQKYLTVIKQYGDSSVAVTAALLLRYIDGFRQEVEKIMKSDIDSIEKGEKLYKLIAYRESLEVLRKIEKNAKKSELERLSYYKGRTMEELGDKTEALKIYQKIIVKNPKSRFAGTSNSRIYLMGKTDIKRKKLKELAVENNRLIRDKTFEKLREDEKIPLLAGTGTGLAEKIIEERDYQEPEVDQSLINTMITEVKVKTTRKKVKPVRTRPVKVKIFTRDGNIFNGEIVSENKKIIRLKSPIGYININKKDVTKRIKQQ